MCACVCLSGNLEHVIRGVVLLNSACISGREAEAAIELHRADKADLDTVCFCVCVFERESM